MMQSVSKHVTGESPTPEKTKSSDRAEASRFCTEEKEDSYNYEKLLYALVNRPTRKVKSRLVSSMWPYILHTQMNTLIKIGRQKITSACFTRPSSSPSKVLLTASSNWLAC